MIYKIIDKLLYKIGLHWCFTRNLVKVYSNLYQCKICGTQYIKKEIGDN